MIPLRDDNPSGTPQIVTIAFIVMCVLVFLWQLSFGAQGGQRIVYALGVVPASLLGQGQLPPELSLVSPWMTVFTSMFMHGGWMHLIGNMLYLWIFGDNVEDRMGRGRFIAFYLICGAIAALTQALPDTRSTVPMIGASGAVSGVLGAYVVLYPCANVLVAMPFLLARVPALIVLGLWFVGQLVSSMLAEPGASSVAFVAHIGGFIGGAGLIRWFLRERRQRAV